MTKLWTNITNFFKPKKYLAAVSGGPDSMAMLDLFKKKISVVCHVNYNKRNESWKDQEVVAAYCQKNNITFEVLNVDESIYEEYKEIKNFQAKARKIRYDFFKKIAQKYNLYGVYIAHNFNDFLETAYMQYARESKALYYGIKEKNIINDLIVERPVINVLKKALLRHCIDNKIDFVIDQTNNTDIYERNRVRKEIEAWTTDQLYDFKKKILKYNKENKWSAIHVEELFKDFEKSKFNLEFFRKQNIEHQHYLLFFYLNKMKIRNVSDNKINAIINFLENKTNKNKMFRIQENIYVKSSIDNELKIVFGADEDIEEIIEKEEKNKEVEKLDGNE